MTREQAMSLVVALAGGNTTYGSVGYVVEYAKKHPEDDAIKTALLKAVLGLIAGGCSQADMYALSLLPLLD
jgi:hypothetical protein